MNGVTSGSGNCSACGSKIRCRIEPPHARSRTIQKVNTPRPRAAGAGAAGLELEFAGGVLDLRTAVKSYGIVRVLGGAGACDDAASEVALEVAIG